MNVSIMKTHIFHENKFDLNGEICSLLRIRTEIFEDISLFYRF